MVVPWMAEPRMPPTMYGHSEAFFLMISHVATSGRASSSSFSWNLSEKMTRLSGLLTLVTGFPKDFSS